jgi:ABC-type Fe3+-hydroxamate transport system substrate-binding protein
VHVQSGAISVSINDTYTDLRNLGGGSNIFAGLKQSWTSGSWEQVVKADPQCIIIND